MMVRAKMACVDVVPRPENNGFEIALEPVISGSKENESFFQYTPWGSVRLGVVKAETAAHFKPGKEFYVDFTPADE